MPPSALDSRLPCVAIRSRTRSLLACLVALLAFGVVTARATDAPAPELPTYTVGVLTDNYPFSYREDASGPVKGYVVDLLARIEGVMGLKLERRIGSTREINSAFERGELDMLQSFVPSEERHHFAAFSNPYLSKEMSGAIFVHQRETRIATLADLHGRTVAVHQNSLGEKVLRDAGLGDSILTVGSVSEGFRKVNDGLADATLASRLTGLLTIDHLDLRRVVVLQEPVPNYRVSYCFAVLKDHAELLNRLNEGLGIVQTSAEGSELYLAWFGHVDETPFDRQQLTVAVSVGLAIALVIALVAGLHQRRLRQRMARQATSLRASEESYRTVFEATIDGLLVLGHARDTNRGWAILQLNQAVSRILGKPALPALPVPFLKAFPGEETLWERIAATLDSADTPAFEHDRSRDGRIAWVRVSVVRLGEDRRLVVLHDTTESRLAAEAQRTNEARLRQNQKLEAIGTLASGIAHDFNNILTAIIGNIELMRFDLPSDHPAAPSLREITEASNRARFLVRQILTFSRRTEPRRAVSVVTPIVKETLRFISATAPSSLEIRHTVRDRSPAIQVDPTQLHQVIMNLCTNAVHAMAGRPGILEVEEAAVTITADSADHPAELSPGEHLLITVRDTGAGMSQEVLQRLFEPFFTTKPAGEGSGLGLAVVHGIVRDSGGAIAVTSSQGVGTSMRLYFPVATLPASDPEPAQPPSIPGGQGQCVLLVDDEPAIILATGQLLKRLGYGVAAFTKPGEALDAFRKRPDDFAVVITDLAMPRLSGIDLAASLRAITPGIPVILMSGFINDRELALARAAHITQLVDKPIAPDVLASALASCLPARPRAPASRLPVL